MLHRIHGRLVVEYTSKYTITCDKILYNASQKFGYGSNTIVQLYNSFCVKMLQLNNIYVRPKVISNEGK